MSPDLTMASQPLMMMSQTQTVMSVIQSGQRQMPNPKQDAGMTALEAIMEPHICLQGAPSFS